MSSLKQILRHLPLGKDMQGKTGETEHLRDLAGCHRRQSL